VRQALHPDRKQRPTSGAVAWVRELARRLQAAARPQAAASGTPQPGVQSASAAPASLPPATSSAPPFPSQGVLLIEGYRRQAVLRLDEAIGRASDGAEIRLAPGEHWLARPLGIDKSLTLVGPGPDQCRVTCAGKGFVIEYSGNGTFAARGIRFEHVGRKPAHVLVITSGQIDLENCVCRGAVWDNERDIGGDGLWATGSAQGTVRNCRFEHNGLNGVELYGNAALTLEGNTCQQNGQCGILFFGNSTGHVQNCQFERNGLDGVALSGNAALTLEGNTCQQNGLCGIAFSDNSTGQVCNNVCRENGVAGIGVVGKSWPTLEANRCEGNKVYGIFFRDSATGNARKNICIGNGRGAIFVAKTAKPELEENEGEGEVVYEK
jgi:parallel beta-helix repeat protein